MVYIGATWRIRLNRPREAAMRSYVKLLSPLVDASDGVCCLFMVALWNRETIYIFMLWFVLSSSFFFFLA